MYSEVNTPLTIDASGISGTHPIALATILGDGCRPTTAPLPIAQATRPVTAGAERIPIAVLPDRRDQALDRSGWRFTHMPSGEYRDSITASRLQRLGVVAGWPDLQFAGPDQKMVFLELKRRGGRLSEAQAAMRAHLRTGFAYLATSDIDLAIEWLKQHGVLRGGFTVQ